MPLSPTNAGLTRDALQERAASDLSVLLEQCSSRDKGPSAKVVKNLAAFYCVDPRHTPLLPYVRSCRCLRLPYYLTCRTSRHLPRRSEFLNAKYPYVLMCDNIFVECVISVLEMEYTVRNFILKFSMRQPTNRPLFSNLIALICCDAETRFRGRPVLWRLFGEAWH